MIQVRDLRTGELMAEIMGDVRSIALKHLEHHKSKRPEAQLVEHGLGYRICEHTLRRTLASGFQHKKALVPVIEIYRVGDIKPVSLALVICRWLLAAVLELGKRIIPILDRHILNK